MSEPPARSSSAEKKAIRLQIASLLAGIPRPQRLQLDAGIREQLRRWILASEEVAHAKAILATLPLPGEPDLTPLLAELLEHGRRVVVPAVDPATSRSMRLLEVADARGLGQTRPGALGTREPVSGREVSLSEIDLALVPGVAFASSGARLGRGGGYFDTLLRSSQWRGAAVGVALECQLLPELPTEPHDSTVDWLCTERGVRATA